MPDPLSIDHRRQQLALRSRAMADLATVWPAMDWSKLDATFPAWATIAGSIITNYRQASTALAAGYLRRHRLAQGIPGPAPIVTAGPVPDEQMHIVLATTALWGVKAATSRGVSIEVAMGNAFVRSSGAATRLILAGGRTTITESAKVDARAAGYVRVTSGNCCDFCAQLADFAEGNDALNTDFEAHDHCGCSAELIYA